MSDPDTMEAGDDMDRLVWTRVLGRSADSFPIPEPYTHDSDWYPSTDMSAAWQVVEHLRDRWTVQIRSDGERLWCVTFRTSTVHHAKGDTAPLAICRAALKMVGG